MTREIISFRVILALVLRSLASSTWALDADDQDSADSSKKDTASKTEGAAAGSSGNFDPPNDDHPNPVAPVATHATGASASGGASLAEAATDPSAILTQFQNFFWTTGSSDDKNISNTYLLWYDRGYAYEKVFDVVWSDMDKRKREVCGTKAKPICSDLNRPVPPVGNTVDLKTATYTNNIGATQLSAVWTDPEFNPAHHAVYYVRVLEIPTPRWTTYDAVKLGIDPPKDVDSTIQERAWTSPIWYTPTEDLIKRPLIWGQSTLMCSVPSNFTIKI